MWSSESPFQPAWNLRLIVAKWPITCSRTVRMLPVAVSSAIFAWRIVRGSCLVQSGSDSFFALLIICWSCGGLGWVRAARRIDHHREEEEEYDERARSFVRSFVCSFATTATTTQAPARPAPGPPKPPTVEPEPRRKYNRRSDARGAPEAGRDGARLSDTVPQRWG